MTTDVTYRKYLSVARTYRYGHVSCRLSHSVNFLFRFVRYRPIQGSDAKTDALWDRLPGGWECVRPVPGQRWVSELWFSYNALVLYVLDEDADD